MTGDKKVALIVGAGPQLGASCARRFALAGLVPVVSSRSPEKLQAVVAAAPGAIAMPCDAGIEADVERLIDTVERQHGAVDCCVYNPGGGFQRTAVVDQTAERFEAGWRNTALGGFLVGRGVARRMVPRGRGTIIFTGATASMRGGKGFSAFAAGKFALRALAQSMARELQPSGIHVVHVVIDGKIRSAGVGANDGTAMDPDEIAATYAGLYFRGKSNWTQEIDIRPWNETW